LHEVRSLNDAKPVSQRDPHGIAVAQQRLVLCHLMIDIMKGLHKTYAPQSEPFGTRLETAFIGLCVALGEFEQKPFSVAKIAKYMHVPRATATRRLARLEKWGLVHRRGHSYYMDKKTLNSLFGMRSYRHNRRLLDKAQKELAALDAHPE
jgi:hypothetical protein